MNRTLHGMPALSDAALANEQLSVMARSPEQPDPSAPAPQRELVSLVFLRSGGRWFALPAETVAEVATKGPVTRVPGTSRTILGLTLVRGRLVPVISLPALVGFAPAGEAAATLPRLVIVRADQTELALVADEIRGVIEHDRTAEDRGHASDRAPFLAEELSWQGRLACVIDVRGLVAAVQRGAV
jgi:purine-binding chemotaxis protein CheW